MRKVIMDVDTGVDDALAILMALKSKELDVLGITTVSGNVTAIQGAINTIKILKLLDISNIPVYSGSETPKTKMSKPLSIMHGKDGLYEALSNFDVVFEDEKRDKAVDFIINTIMEHSKEGVTLILTAPLTNIALALKKAPHIINHINEAIIMGGAIKCSGNITPYAEFNIYKDPEAAKDVISSGIPITMITLDVTNKAIVMEEDLNQISNKKLRDFLIKALGSWINRYERKNRIRGCILHDPLTVAYAINKDIIKVNMLSIDIMLKGAEEGKTFCVEDGDITVNASVDINNNEFIAVLKRILNS